MDTFAKKYPRIFHFYINYWAHIDTGRILFPVSLPHGRDMNGQIRYSEWLWNFAVKIFGFFRIDWI